MFKYLAQRIWKELLNGCDNKLYGIFLSKDSSSYRYHIYIWHKGITGVTCATGISCIDGSWYNLVILV